MKSFLILASTVILGGITSCSKNDSTPATNSNAKVQLVLTDAPAAYDAVNIEIKSIQINTGGDADSNWVTYPVTPAIYDLLQLRNGGYVTMGDPVTLPAGKIEQIRLILGTNNSVIVDGQSYALTTPSAQQSGLKINFHKELSSDGVYKIWLDFDAGRSIVKTGNGKYILKPVIKAFSEEINGQIRGYVLPTEAKTIVYALKGMDTTASAIPASDGYFKFIGLSDGAYSIKFDADDATGYMDSIINNVTVVYGKVTDVGTSTLHK